MEKVVKILLFVIVILGSLAFVVGTDAHLFKDTSDNVLFNITSTGDSVLEGDLILGSLFTIGDIGIGYSEPPIKLYVAKDDALGYSTTLTLADAGARCNSVFENPNPAAETALIGFRTRVSSRGDGYFGIVHIGAKQQDFVWGLRDGSGSVPERMRLTWEGDLGIGTATPNAKLDVVGTAYIGSATKYLHINTTSFEFVGANLSVNTGIYNKNQTSAWTEYGTGIIDHIA